MSFNNVVRWNILWSMKSCSSSDFGAVKRGRCYSLPFTSCGAKRLLHLPPAVTALLSYRSMSWSLLKVKRGCFFYSKLDNHSRAFSAVVVHGRYLFSRITLLVFVSSEGSSRFLWTSSIYIISSHAWEAMWKRYLLATLCPVIFIFQWDLSSALMVWWVHSAQALRCDWEHWGKVTVTISHPHCLQTKEELADKI